ncbi:MAG: hypothetical protein NTAFB01_13060 [Nitrospira sp.]
MSRPIWLAITAALLLYPWITLSDDWPNWLFLALASTWAIMAFVER